MMKIAIAGAGYVGLSIAVLLARRNEVRIRDILPEKVSMINEKKSPIIDAELEEYLSAEKLDLLAVTDEETAYKDADFIIAATRTSRT